MRSLTLSRFLVPFLVAVSTAAAAGRISPPDIPFVFPEIRIPFPKLQVAPVSISRPLFGGVATPRPEVYLGFACGGVFGVSELDFPAYGLIDLFGSVEDYRTSLAAEKVEIVELQPIVDPFTMPMEKAESAIPLPERDAAVLRAVLTYDTAYDWSAVSPVPSRDGYRVKFRAGNRVIALDLFLSTRCARVPSLSRVPPSARFDFCYSTVASIINRHFPGATD